MLKKNILEYSHIDFPLIFYFKTRVRNQLKVIRKFANNRKQNDLVNEIKLSAVNPSGIFNNTKQSAE